MLKVMIVGAGAIAPAHIEGFLEFSERVEIKVICNPTIEKAQKLIELYNLDAVAVSSMDEQLESIDVVSVCSPPSTHKDIAVKYTPTSKSASTFTK